MQHKKALIAAAVAAALTASANASAEATVYGKIHTSIAAISQDNAGTKNSATAISSHASRVGVKGSKKLGNGMEVIGQVELEVDAATGSYSKDYTVGDSTNTGSTTVTDNYAFKARNTFVGLKGGFGTVLVGVHDTPHKMSTGKLDPFGDTYADYNNIITEDHRLNNVLAYINKFSAVTVAAAYYAGDDSVTGENKGNATSVMAAYDQGPLYLSVAVESHADTVAGNVKTATKVGASYKIGPAQIAIVSETLAMDTAKDQTEMYASLKYKVSGSTSINAAFGSRDDGVSATKDGSMSAVGVSHKLDKSASVYAFYASGKDGGLAKKGKLKGDGSALSLGMKYKF